LLESDFHEIISKVQFSFFQNQLSMVYHNLLTHLDAEVIKLSSSSSPSYLSLDLMLSFNFHFPSFSYLSFSLQKQAVLQSLEENMDPQLN